MLHCTGVDVSTVQGSTVLAKLGEFKNNTLLSFLWDFNSLPITLYI